LSGRPHLTKPWPKVSGSTSKGLIEMALRSIPMKDTPWSTPHGVCLMGLTLYLNVQLHRLVIYPLKKCPSLPKCVSSQQLWQQYWANVTKIQHYNHSNMFTQCRWKTTKMAENVTFTSIYRFQTWGGANANASEQFVPKYLIYKKVFEKTNTFLNTIFCFIFHSGYSWMVFHLLT